MRRFTRFEAANIGTVARREFIARASTRTFLVTTLLLVVLAAVVGLAPVIVSYVNRGSSQIAVYVGAADLRGDPIATLDAILNPPASSVDSRSVTKAAFAVRRSTDLAADRQQVLSGQLTALVDVERDGQGQATFTVYTNEPADSPTAVISRQAATSIALADRLGHAGLTPADQASLFAPPQVVLRSPDLSKPAASPQALTDDLANYGVTVGLEMFLLLAIILYGTWVAQSVVEEKSSRMMEIILCAASPFQILAGKVLGVSSAALLQYAAMVAAVLVALLAQGVVASSILGESAGVSLPSGLTPSLLVAFSLFFVLGFVLYAVLFAAAGSLVSRQEDVSQIVMPMTLLASAGYMIALFGSSGSMNAEAPWVVALSFVPFLSPYLMVSRVAAGTAGALEVSLAILILVVTIVLVVWIAARIYAAGVLMYGQKPSITGLWKAAREARS